MVAYGRVTRCSPVLRRHLHVWAARNAEFVGSLETVLSPSGICRETEHPAARDLKTAARSFFQPSVTVLRQHDERLLVVSLRQRLPLPLLVAFL